MTEQTITTDAIGPTVTSTTEASGIDPQARARELAIMDALRSVVDPEIGGPPTAPIGGIPARAGRPFSRFGRLGPNLVLLLCALALGDITHQAQIPASALLKLVQANLHRERGAVLAPVAGLESDGFPGDGALL